MTITKLKKNELLSFSFEIMILIISFIGILLNIILFKSIIGIFYFTIFSSLTCFIFYFAILILKISKKFIKTDNYYKYKGLILVNLLCTFLIYNFYLLPFAQIQDYNGHLLTSSLVHIVLPIFVVIDYLINEKDSKLKYSYLTSWCSFILFYGILILLYQKIGGTFLHNDLYPYFNFNYATYGVIKCALFDVLIMLFYLLLCILFIFIDKKIKNR